MVVDLQGVVTSDSTGKKMIILTDPAIHCKDTTRFESTNLGEDGINAFFGAHECSKFCKALEELPESVFFASNQPQKNMESQYSIWSPTIIIGIIAYLLYSVFSGSI